MPATGNRKNRNPTGLNPTGETKNNLAMWQLSKYKIGWFCVLIYEMRTR